MGPLGPPGGGDPGSDALNRSFWRELTGWALVSFLLLAVGLFAWMTRHPESGWLDLAAERVPLLQPVLERFRQRWSPQPRKPGEPSSSAQSWGPADRGEPPAGARRAPPLERSGAPSLSGPQQRALKHGDPLAQSAGRVEAPPEPERTGRRIEPELRARLEERLGTRAVTEGLGPYDLLVEPGWGPPLERWRALVESLEGFYAERLGLVPPGRARETVVLLGDPSLFEELVQEWEPTLDVSQLDGIATRGAAILPVANRRVEEVEASLVHELAHLLNRRTFGQPLPDWLEEGLAEALACSPFDPERGWEPDAFREIRSGDASRVLLAGCAARLLVLGEALERKAVPGLTRLLEPSASELFEQEPELARGASGFLVLFWLAEPQGHRAQGFRSFLDLVAAGAEPEAALLFSLLGESRSSVEASWIAWVLAARDRYVAELRREGLEPSGPSSALSREPRKIERDRHPSTLPDPRWRSRDKSPSAPSAARPKAGYKAR